MFIRAAIPYVFSLILHSLLIFFVISIASLSLKPEVNSALKSSSIEGVSVFTPKSLHSSVSQTVAKEEGIVPSASHSIEINENAEKSYILMLQTRIQSQSHYPLEARKRNLQGVIEVEFELNENGSIENITTKNTANMAILANSAQEAVIHAAPFERPPIGISHHFVIPIEFKIK